MLAAAIHLHGSNTKVGLVWRDFARAQKFAVGTLLAWPIPILNLLIALVLGDAGVFGAFRISAASEYLVLDALWLRSPGGGHSFTDSVASQLSIWRNRHYLASIGATPVSWVLR